MKQPFLDIEPIKGDRQKLIAFYLKIFEKAQLSARELAALTDVSEKNLSFLRGKGSSHARTETYEEDLEKIIRALRIVGTVEKFDIQKELQPARRRGASLLPNVSKKESSRRFVFHYAALETTLGNTKAVISKGILTVGASLTTAQLELFGRARDHWAWNGLEGRLAFNSEKSQASFWFWPRGARRKDEMAEYHGLCNFNCAGKSFKDDAIFFGSFSLPGPMSGLCALEPTSLSNEAIERADVPPVIFSQLICAGTQCIGQGFAPRSMAELDKLPDFETLRTSAGDHIGFALETIFSRTGGAQHFVNVIKAEIEPNGEAVFWSARPGSAARSGFCSVSESPKIMRAYLDHDPVRNRFGTQLVFKEPLGGPNLWLGVYSAQERDNLDPNSGLIILKKADQEADLVWIKKTQRERLVPFGSAAFEALCERYSAELALLLPDSDICRQLEAALKNALEPKNLAPAP